MRRTEKEKAIKLRKNGYSYNYISEKLNVSKGTLSYWLSKISYKPNKEMEKKIKESKIKMIEYKRNQKKQSFLIAKESANKDIKNLTKRDLFMLGLGLYIGEGTKSHDIIRVINANPKIIKLAMRWFEKICGMTKKNFSIAIHIYPDNNKKECLSFWSKYTNIPLGQFGKVQIDKRKKKKSKRGKLSYGTAHLTIKSNGNKEFGVFLFRKIQAWTDRVLS